MLYEYLGHSVRLAKIYYLSDAKSGLRPQDIETIKLLNKFNKPIQVVLTKTDKVVPHTKIIQILIQSSM